MIDRNLKYGRRMSVGSGIDPGIEISNPPNAHMKSPQKIKKIVPHFVVVSGIDGSGKTTVVEGVQRALEERGLRCQYAWMRYTHIFVKPLHALARLAGLTRRHDTPLGRVWRHEFYRFPVFAKIYLPLTWVDTWLGRRRLMAQVDDRHPDVVICDRWADDILIDLAVDFHAPEMMQSIWARRLRTLMPARAQHIAILRDRASLLTVRPESIHDPDFDLRLSLYEDLPAEVHVLRNDSTMEAAVARVLSLIEPQITKVGGACRS